MRSLHQTEGGSEPTKVYIFVDRTQDDFARSAGQDTEQAKFDVGASTSFFIIQYQSFLAQARSTVVVAKSAYLKARAALERATGTILDDNHVSLADAIRGR